MESRQKALLAASAARTKHAEDIAVLDVGGLSSVTEFFVIGTAETHRQLVAIVEEIQEEFLRHGERIWHVEGVSPRSASASAQPNSLAWVLLDCGDLVIHLFNPPARTFYYLERLWADAPRVPLDSHA